MIDIKISGVLVATYTLTSLMRLYGYHVWVSKTTVPWLIRRLSVAHSLGGTVRGAITTYYYGFLFRIFVNSIIWWVISYAVSRFVWKSTGLDDPKKLNRYFLLKTKRAEKRYTSTF